MFNFIVLSWLVSTWMCASGINLYFYPEQANIYITTKESVTLTFILNGTGSNEADLQVQVNGVAYTSNTDNQTSSWELTYSDSSGYAKYIDNDSIIMLTIAGNSVPGETVEVNISATYMSEFEHHTIMIHIQDVIDTTNTPNYISSSTSYYTSDIVSPSVSPTVSSSTSYISDIVSPSASPTHTPTVVITSANTEQRDTYITIGVIAIIIVLLLIILISLIIFWRMNGKCMLASQARKPASIIK